MITWAVRISGLIRNRWFLVSGNISVGMELASKERLSYKNNRECNLKMQGLNMCAIKSICFSAELLLPGALACHSFDYSEPFLILIIPFLCARYTTP